MVGYHRDRLAKPRGVPVEATTAWCSHSPVIRAAGQSASLPWPLAQVGRSGPSTLDPASSTIRPGAGRLTTVAATISATSSMAATPSSTCWASLSAYTPGRSSLSAPGWASRALGVEPPLRSTTPNPAAASPAAACARAVASSAAACAAPPGR